MFVTKCVVTPVQIENSNINKSTYFYACMSFFSEKGSLSSHFCCITKWSYCSIRSASNVSVYKTNRNCSPPMMTVYSQAGTLSTESQFSHCNILQEKTFTHSSKRINEPVFYFVVMYCVQLYIYCNFSWNMWPFNKPYCPSGQNMICETQTDQSEVEKWSEIKS
jgi:hypothetical protein